MEYYPIAELRPELPAIESKQIKAVVTLIWPYSSSARQFALLLAEPNIRLRRRNGQVRARFFGSSARAMAGTRIGIGDEVALSLRGASFVRGHTVSTPGKSIDYELEYTQTVSVRITRNGTELATLDLTDVAPTPANRSPVRPTRHRPSLSAIEEPAKWSSPAFLKRTRLSEGPIFEAGYDPFTDDVEDEHVKKRRRKSYRDWSAWTYSARTPSPDKGDESSEDSDVFFASPTRPAKLPYTPVSPSKPVKSFDTASQNEQSNIIDLSDDDDDYQQDEISEETVSENNIELEDRIIEHPLGQLAEGALKRGNNDHHSYAEPVESHAINFSTDSHHRPSDGTDNDVQRDAVPVDEIAYTNNTGIITLDDSDGEEDEQHDRGPAVASKMDAEALSHHDEYESKANQVETDVTAEEVDAIRFEFDGPISVDEHAIAQASPTFEWTGDLEDPIVLDEDTSPVVMAPPTLPLLQTSFPAAPVPAMLTPIGNEPKSPNLRPLDSSTLPMPSPFPDEQDATSTSYLEHASHSPLDGRTEVRQEHIAQDLDSIDTSFYSSVGSSTAPAFHESAFTDVRFTFGLDGSVFSSMLPARETENGEDIEADPEPRKETSKAIDVQNAAEAKAASETRSPSFIAEFSHAEIQDTNADSTSLVIGSIPAEQGTDPIAASEPSGSIQVVMHEKALSKSQQEPKDLDSNDAATNTQYIDTDGDGEHEHENLLEHTTSNQIINEAQQVPITEDVHSVIDVPDASALVTEIVDLGSGSSDLSDEDSSIEDITAHEPHSIQGDSKSPTPAAPDRTELPGEELVDQGPDIKIESIEDVTLHLEQQKTLPQETEGRDFGEPDTVSSRQMLIEIPDGERIGENHVVSVPATAPARNTRSKTKLISSPVKAERPLAHHTPRARRGRQSLDSIAHTTRSPSATTSRFTTSPTPTSPYNLRSHSKPYSPAQMKAANLTPTKIHKKASNQESIEAHDNNRQEVSQDFFDPAELELPNWSSFGPSQELGASQGRFSDVAYIKDSEEGSLHSENSLSTVQYSDDLMVVPQTYADSRQSVEPRANVRDRSPVMKQNELENGSISDIASSQLVVNTSPASKPIPRATPNVTAGTPRRSRRLRKDVYDLTTDDDEPSEVPTPKQTSHGPHDSHALLYTEGDGRGASLLLSSGSAEEAMTSSPPASQTQFPSTKQQLILHSNNLATPEATQQTRASQSSLPAGQQEPHLPMTPQLTQTPSAGLSSFHTSHEATADETESHTTLNRSLTAVPAKTIPPPSIGLSTPIAYYTPLKDLPYFLNRSSQFHSSSYPDTLALVTSPTSSPKKAPKGPRDYHTTLSITDLSTYPSTTSVQVFRRYAAALPVAERGDVVLLRAFGVKSAKRMVGLVSGEDSAWCVWRFGKLLWGKGKGEFAEIRAREEVNGPGVERGEGEWREVARLREWFLGRVKAELEEKDREEREEREERKKEEGERARL